MALTINTNLASLNAQRNLSRAQGDIAKPMQRLSSGLRINSAKDDAAGLAISDRMTTQIRGLNQAVRNANDGISLAQTAEGAMQEMTNALQRMRELAVQASNGTYTARDRQSMEAEINQLQDELDRIARNTTYNGMNILDGTYSTTGLNFQVGANAGQTVSFTIDSLETENLGEGTTVANTKVPLMTVFSAGDALNALNNFMEANFNSYYTDPTQYDPSTGAFLQYDPFVAARDKIEIDYGLFIVGSGGSFLQLWDGDLYIAGSGATATFTASETTGSGAMDTKTIDQISVLTPEEAQTAIGSVDVALEQIDAERGKLGAIQNRFDSIISNLSNVSENLSAARSRILDADIAKETSALTKNNILQQAGASVLAQANGAPKLALSLLEGA